MKETNSGIPKLIVCFLGQSGGMELDEIYQYYCTVYDTFTHKRGPILSKLIPAFLINLMGIQIIIIVIIKNKIL